MTEASTTQSEGTPPRRREVPRVRGGLPIVGHAFSFGRDPDGFIAASRARHGDLFRVRYPDGERTFLLDPFDYPNVFGEPRLRFQELGAEIGGRVFGFRTEDAVGDDFQELSHITSRDLRGDILQTASERMQKIFVARVRAEVSRGPIERPLLELLSDHFFAAGTDALFGDGFATRDLYRNYATVDRWFAAAVAGAPARLLPGFIRARQALAASMAQFGPEHSALIDARNALFERIALPIPLRRAFDASVLWASQANTVVAAFWTVYYLLADARARDAVVAEVRSVVGRGSASDELPLLSRDALRRLVLLDSACSEAMRLTSGPMNSRRVTESFDFPLTSGGVLSLGAGDDLLLYPRNTHFDPEIFEEPNAFRFDRFVDPDGRPTRFEKGGRKLTMAFLPFGGGLSMCPGRFFARNEIKVLVATLFATLDTTLLTREAPALDFSRIGLGVLPPKSDVRIRVSRRSGT